MIKELEKDYDLCDTIKIDGYDKAIIGIEEDTMRLVYSMRKSLNIIVARDGVNNSDALEWFFHNVRHKLVSDSYGRMISPIWVNDLY